MWLPAEAPREPQAPAGSSVFGAEPRRWAQPTSSHSPSGNTWLGQDPPGSSPSSWAAAGLILTPEQLLSGAQGLLASRVEERQTQAPVHMLPPALSSAPLPNLSHGSSAAFLLPFLAANTSTVGHGPTERPSRAPAPQSLQLLQHQGEPLHSNIRNIPRPPPVPPTALSALSQPEPTPTPGNHHPIPRPRHGGPQAGGRQRRAGPVEHPTSHSQVGGAAVPGEVPTRSSGELTLGWLDALRSPQCQTQQMLGDPSLLCWGPEPWRDGKAWVRQGQSGQLLLLVPSMLPSPVPSGHQHAAGQSCWSP